MNAAFDPRQIPFSRRGSWLFLETDDDGVLKLRRQYKAYRIERADQGEEKPFACAFSFGKAVQMEAAADALSIRGENGWAQMCFDGTGMVRIRGEGMKVRLHAPMEQHSQAQGSFRLVPLSGEWNITPEWTESGETAFELCICYGDAMPSGRSFEECRAEALSDFERWQGMYPALLAQHEGIRALATYSIWICWIEPTGLMKGPLMLYRKNDSAFCWQSAYHAMAVRNDAEMAVELLHSIFAWQDEYGQLPDLADDRNVEFLSTKPPMQGFAFLFMLKTMGDRITRAHCEKLYPAFERWCQWWMRMRDSDHDGMAQYNQGCECAMDTSAMFEKGTPVECPDLAAYLILLCEALGEMAARMERPDQQNMWKKRADTMLRTLVDEFWNGRRFVARLSGSHEIVEVEESDIYTPIILGRRLPEEIIRQMTQDLRRDYLTPIGIRHAPAHQHVPLSGIVGSFWQVKLVIGLYEAGEEELAMEIARRFTDVSVKRLPALGYPVGESADGPAHASAVTALPCGIFFILAGLLKDWSTTTQHPNC